ncbi:C3G [Drosophila busckii]|uniref:C3G n=1 Tax=Drosophila busckii TaxID=30019 RepID=A0A0M4ESF0_DROBS|nr:C3G [Drosophila busckii]
MNVLHKMDGSISSPSTPSNCSAVGVGGGCNSSSNNSINSSIYAGHSSSSGSTPPPPQAATTPQQQQQQYNTRLGAAAGAGTGVGVAAVVPPAPPTSGGATGSSGHKNSLKGTKLARRARSFKDDLIEKISLMRTTNNTLGRSHSPHSPRSNKHGHKPPPSNEEVQRSTQTLETHVKDISNALKHFRDVILKKKLEVLPGNGTVILETIASMYSVIQSYTLNENSAIMSCATQQVYQSLGKLIKLCDEVMLSEKSGECASLSNENVREVIDLLEDAVRNLVTLAQGKLKEQDQSAFRYSAGGLCGIGAAADIMGAVTVATVAGSPAGGSVASLRSSDAAAAAVAAAAAALVAQRTSLPDIALTPKERDILMGQGNDSHPIRGSHSTESILRDTSPPPKPPLPNRASNPPPLPPKRRSQPTATPAAQSAQFAAIAANQSVVAFPYAQSHNISINSDLDCSSNTSLLNYGVDRLSVRSRSPDENSQCSFDSALNHSRDEEEQPTQLQLQPPPPKKPIMLRKQLDEDLDKLISYILAYMEICSANSHSVEQHRHTMHAYNISRNMSHSQTMNIMSVSKQLSPELETPPALPPKNYKQRKPSTAGAGAGATPPASPKSMLGDVELRQHRMQTVSEELSDAQTSSEQQGASATEEAASGGGATGNGNVFFCHELPSDNAKPASSPKLLLECANVEQQAAEAAPLLEQEEEEQRMLQQLQLLDDDEELEEEEEEEQEEPANQLPNMLEEIDITPYLILKKREEDGPEVKGGYIDALIVHASRVQKVADNAFSEAFITTFRTFIQPIDVIEKLTHRYTYFFCQVHDQKQKAAKETFSLLVRVVNDLTSTDLTNQLLSLLVEFVYQLVCSGQLYLAKLLRNKFVEKVTLFKDQRSCAYMPELGPSSSSTGTAQLSLLDLKSLEIAEQMTLLDAELFMKIEIPEVLLFAKDQCEEKSPNLNKFTEHFNKMSFWARSKILRLHDTKEREKHVNKFIKIMKHLRKMNNYNSYLALLSALDSGPIRRLEWQKGTTEEVRGFCALIDSSSSFRAYRQALAETNPPCIPYIAYPFRRNERIIGFFDNFKDFMGEEEMWQISERIKPRGKRQPNY